MINWTLFQRELKAGWKLLVIFAAVLTMYVICIISLYDPATMAMLDGFTEAMPELMAAVGMKAGAANLLGFMISYLYGFILLVFPMVFSILRSSALVAKYVEQGSMAALIGAPIKRYTIAFTQMCSLIVDLLFLVIYVTVLELAASHWMFPGELSVASLLTVNTGLLFLQLFIGSVSFFASCAASSVKSSALFGAGIPVLMYIFQMIAGVGGEGEKMKYFTVFTLFDPSGLAAGEMVALCKTIVLLLGAIVLYVAAIVTFCKKDFHI